MRLPWRRGDRASSLDLLVVGLGNPGREYARHRHNAGWRVLDEGAPTPEPNSRGRRRPGAPPPRFYKLEPDAILVVHDEGDFDLGRLQARLGGGLAGHNGLRSIAPPLNTPT